MSKIPARQPRSHLPVPKTVKVQALAQNLLSEDPVRLPPARRMLSRRSKSHSDLRAVEKADIKKLTVPTPSNLLQSASTSKSNLAETRKVAVKTAPRTVTERPAIKPITRATTKRPAPAAEEAVKAKVSKPAKIPPYDYKARFNQLTERHATLQQTYKDAQQKLRDNEIALQEFEGVKNDKVRLQDDYNRLCTEHERTTAQNQMLTMQAHDCKVQFDQLTEEHATLMLRYKQSQQKLQECEENLQEHKAKVNTLTFELAEANTAVNFLKEEVHDFKSLLQSNEELRRSMHNQIQDLKGTIRVFCRVRPATSDEQCRLLYNISVPDEATLEIKKTRENTNCISGKPADVKQEFNFDKVFPPEATQAEVFEELAQLIQSALDGYHVCVFAYGQTGSGKTYTMQGEDVDTAAGMIPRTVELIFSLIANLQKIGWTYTVEANFLEIYNETLRDLLQPNKRENLEIRYNEGKGTTVTNLTISQVESVEQLRRLMATANSNRAIAATACNEHSSRSHAVTKITLRGCNKEMGITYVGSLNLVDLAGSESAKTSTSERMAETKNINKSLTTLGSVIAALHNRDSHIPYRNSKLTYLLQSCLGGNSKTLMFVNIAPFEECYGESINSLRFAAKVKEVKLGSRRNKMYLQRELSNVAK